MHLPNPRFRDNYLYTDLRKDRYGVFADEHAAINSIVDVLFILVFVVLLASASFVGVLW
jgi:hypothetical protein